MPYIVVRYWSNGYPLKLGQTLKLGKLSAQIKAIRVNTDDEALDPQLLFPNYHQLKVINLDQDKGRKT